MAISDRPGAACIEGGKSTGACPSSHGAYLCITRAKIADCFQFSSQCSTCGQACVSNHAKSVCANCLTNGAMAMSASAQCVPERYGVWLSLFSSVINQSAA